MTTYTDLVSAVTAQTTVEQSLLTLINGLVTEAQTAKAANDTTHLDVLLSSIQSNTKLLADAVTANTPVASATTPAAPASTPAVAP